MNVKFKDFGLYNVDVEYLRYLNQVDSEVQFSEQKAYEQKPFLGIIVLIGTYTYFVPLTSGKQKHTKWKNVGQAHYLIYEQVDKQELCKKDIFKSISDTEVLKIFAALDLKKMIPVKEGCYSRINFALLEDRRYADLLEKEYRFCMKIQDGILTKANQIYTQQKETGIVYPLYCSFAKLEAACDAYRNGDHPAADGLGDQKSAGTVRGTGQTAQADFWQDQHEENAQGHPGYPGVSHDQSAVSGIPEAGQALPPALSIYPGQGWRAD